MSGAWWMPKCDCCGRFMRQDPGSSFAMRYSGWPLAPSHEAFRCAPCTQSQGPIPAQHGVADWTAGIVPACDASSAGSKL